MKLQSILKSITFAELLVLSIFIIYLVLPIPTPNSISPYIESPLGMIVIFCITVALFLYANPILAILYIFVGYTLLRRSAIVSGQTAYIQYTATPAEKEAEIKREIKNETPPNQPSQPQQRTLEEEVVAKMAPIGKSELSVFTPSTFKPVATNVNGASSI